MNWTEQEHRLLREMAAAGIGAPVIASQLGRTMQAVTQQAHLMGIRLTWPKAKSGWQGPRPPRLRKLKRPAPDEGA